MYDPDSAPDPETQKQFRDGFLSRIRIFPSRIQGQYDSGYASKNFEYFKPKKFF